MPKQVVGLFDTMQEAEATVRELRSAGVSENDISFVARNADSSGYTSTEDEVGEGAAFGATGGAVVGGLTGLLVGIGALAIPGVGPVIAGGALVSTLVGAGVGAAAGGLLGALVGAGIPEDDANIYAEGVRRGGALVMATVDDTMVDTTLDIMERNNVVDLDERGASYRESGWSRYDESMTTGDADSVPDGDDYARSSKVGTAGGTLAGAATGAAMGAAGGPVGAVIGGVAGAITGGAVGAAGDAAGQEASDHDRGSYADDTYATSDAMMNTTTAGDFSDHAAVTDFTADADDMGADEYARSSKVGTVGGGTAGAVTGATMGAVGGPVGAVVGGVAGALVGGSVGAAGDTAGEELTEGSDDGSTVTSSTVTSDYDAGTSYSATGDADSVPGAGDYDRSSKVGTAGGAVAGAATGAAMGSVGGPVGTVIGGAAGALTGGAVGAAGDAAGEELTDNDSGIYDAGTNYDSARMSTTSSADNQSELAGNRSGGGADNSGANWASGQGDTDSSATGGDTGLAGNQDGTGGDDSKSGWATGYDSTPSDTDTSMRSSYSASGDADGVPDAGDYDRSSKVGTAGGAVAGAATGAAMGSVGGPVGTVIGGVAGALTGGAVGAAGDAVGEELTDDDGGVLDTDTGYDSTAPAVDNKQMSDYDSVSRMSDADASAQYAASGDADGTPDMDDYDRSSKVGTAGGTVAGAATGAAMGSVGGPIGTVVGGVAGAITGGSVGAAGDAVGEELTDDDGTADPNRDKGLLNRAEDATGWDVDRDGDVGRENPR